MEGQSRVQTETILTGLREMKESGQGQSSAGEGEGRRAAAGWGGSTVSITVEEQGSLHKDSGERWPLQ